MKVKNFLLNCTSPEQLQKLSRASIFPFYIKELDKKSKDKLILDAK